MGISLDILGPDARKQASEQIGQLTKAQKPNKYGAVPQVDEDGTRHASTKQQRRWHELKLLERTGEIQFLSREVTVRLEVNGVHVCDYRADHHYKENGIWIYEDVKGLLTKEYKIKKKLFRACFGFDIREV